MKNVSEKLSKRLQKATAKYGKLDIISDPAREFIRRQTTRKWYINDIFTANDITENKQNTFV